MNDKNMPSLNGTALQTLTVVALLSLKLLLVKNMGLNNEVNVLPLAKQYMDPAWVPGDWYLNQPPGYRMLFQMLFGKLIMIGGFLATSLAGRLLCYVLVALGIVRIGRRLDLSLPVLLTAVGLFLYNQSLAAGEELAGGLEAKSVAYGLILLAIGLMLEGRYRLTALLLGVATSFHILVGGWAFLAMLGWLAPRRDDRPSWTWFGQALLIYLTGSVFAVKPVLEQLFTSTPPGSIPPSYVYVYLRVPHHVNPMSWQFGWWVKPIVYLLGLAFSVGLLWFKRQPERPPQYYAASIGLAEFTLITLVPFMLGLAVAPFDSKGLLLQYYPFRLGDVMLPLNTCLLFACALEHTFTGRARQGLLLVCIVGLGLMVTTRAILFQREVTALRAFPGPNQQVDPHWKDLCDWVRNNTPKDAIVVTPPGAMGFSSFTWLAERPTIANYKLIPQTKAGILAWYERMRDLSGDTATWPARPLARYSGPTGYFRLTTANAESVMAKYLADYFVTRPNHRLDLPIAHRNSLYTLYTKGK